VIGSSFMSDAKAETDRTFHMPANAQEFWALGISLLTVFVLVQFGAPIVRELDFLDQKLREYFIGIAFAAFPLIHRSAKQSLAGFRVQAPAARPELAPWFVTGVFAAALLFAWNQFASACAAFAMGLLIGQLQVDTEQAAFAGALATSMLAVVLPLSAVAAVFAGVVLNRKTRSHVFAALLLAAVTYVAFNVLLTWAFQPEYLAALFAIGGTEATVGFALGLGLVAIVVIAFGAVGIAISRLNGDASIGRLMQAARRLSPLEREAVTLDILHKLQAEVASHVMAAPSIGETSPASRMPISAEP
jgi:hypothetical protein